MEMEKTCSTIPIVDVSKIVSTSNVEANKDDWIHIGAQIDAALHSTGFVYLKNTGISQEIVDAAFKSSATFFNLDENIKLTYKKDFVETPTGLDYYAGYTPAGAELEGDADYEHKESFDLCGNKRRYPDAHVPFYRDAFDALEIQFKRLTLNISNVLAVSLGLEDIEFFTKSLSYLGDPTGGNSTTLRALYYPPIQEGILKDHQNPMRCAAHTDYGFLTFLLMELDAVGLEVKATSGEWISANPIPGTVLMNVGDFLELWSDGRYPATFHRVQLPSDAAQRSRCRKSIAYFVNPDDSVTVNGLETQFNGGKVQRSEIWNTVEHIMERSRTAYSATPLSNNKSFYM